ncbi:MAG TPA: hemerythrin domain-containing protein [Elusimicrobiota bacterium]|nr:hemerythrin domain-containing protein [Elusimicrobiota bacterium]
MDMPTALLKDPTATELLIQDHELIKSLFRQAEDAGSDERRKKIGDRCLREIEVHSLLEKKIFYPSVRRDLGEERLVAQALVEHEAAERLVNELKGLAAGERYNARLRALREIVEPHIEEEAAGMLPRVENSDMDVEALGQQMLELKRRIDPRMFKEKRLRGAAMIAGGVALAGGIAWLIARALARRGGGPALRSKNPILRGWKRATSSSSRR